RGQGDDRRAHREDVPPRPAADEGAPRRPRSHRAHPHVAGRRGARAALSTDGRDRRAAVRVPADPLEATIEFLERHGFRLELDRAHRGAAELVVPAGGDVLPGRHTGPGGLVVEVTPKARDLPPPAPAFVHTRLADTPVHEGRAGLLYRDLLPSRLGGRWVASHIRAARGGPVNDR